MLAGTGDPLQGQVLQPTPAYSRVQRTPAGREMEAAPGEVLAHAQGEVDLSCRMVDDPAADRMPALRKRLRSSRQKFADRSGLDARALQDWEPGCCVPDRAARVLLPVIDRDSEAVVRALGQWIDKFSTIYL